MPQGHIKACAVEKNIKVMVIEKSRQCPRTELNCSQSHQERLSMPKKGGKSFLRSLIRPIGARAGEEIALKVIEKARR